jgi:hypothetical protein
VPATIAPMQVSIPILHAYVFESDDDSHINAHDLSDLSDHFDEDECEPSPPLPSNIVLDPTPSISLDEIPYDRDLKWINVPTTARPKPALNSNVSRMLKQVDAITSGNANIDAKKSEDRPKKQEERKKYHESKGFQRKKPEPSHQHRQSEFQRHRHTDNFPAQDRSAFPPPNPPVPQQNQHNYNPQSRFREEEFMGYNRREKPFPPQMRKPFHPHQSNHNHSHHYPQHSQYHRDAQMQRRMIASPEPAQNYVHAPLVEHTDMMYGEPIYDPHYDQYDYDQATGLGMSTGLVGEGLGQDNMGGYNNYNNGYFRSHGDYSAYGQQAMPPPTPHNTVMNDYDFSSPHLNPCAQEFVPSFLTR